MSGEATERLIEELAQDLAQVRRVPPLRWALVGVLAIWSALLAAVLLASGGRVGPLAELVSSPVFGGVCAGLLVTAIAATAAAIASGVPGRERVVHTGSGLALAGAIAGVACCLVGIASVGLGFGSPVTSDAVCLGYTALFSLVPAFTVGLLVLRGWVARPLLAAALALLGTAALGAVTAQLSCPFAGPRHLLLGHVSPPMLIVALGSLPAAVLIRRFAR